MYSMLPTIKLVIRYAIVMFYLYLAWQVLQPEWLENIKDLDGPILSVLVGAPYGTLAIILPAHFDNKISDNTNYNKQMLFKLIGRYVILFIIMYMTWFVMDPVWLNSIKDMNAMMISILVGAPYGALAIVLREHYKIEIKESRVAIKETKVETKVETKETNTTIDYNQ